MKHLTFFKAGLLAVALMVGGVNAFADYSGTGVFNKITSMNELTDGYYVITGGTTAYAMGNTHNGTLLAREEVSIASGQITNPAVSVVWRIQTNGSGRTIYNEAIAKYVSYTGSSNNVQVVDAVTANNQRWNITYVSELFVFNNVEISARMLQYNGNAGQERFVCYTSAQQKLSLYKLYVEEGCTPATTSFESASVEKSVVDASFTNTFTSNNTSPQAYSSSNTDVAIVNASTGAVVILGVGTTTISVSQDADDTYCSVLQSYTLTVSPLAAPVATDATNVTGTSFTANWEAVAGATGYELTVYSGVLFLNESFDHLDGTGGNDGGWSGSIAGTRIVSELPGWTFSTYTSGGNEVVSAFKGDKCLKSGTGTALGEVTTPELGLNGDAPLTFRAGAWNGGTEQTELLLEITGGGSLSVSSVEMVKGAFSSYSVNIIGGTATTKITFKGKQAANSRFFLDEVKVGSTTAISGSPFTVTGTSKIITGLTVDTDYYYTVKAIAGSYISAESNEIQVTTTSTPSPTITVEEVLLDFECKSDETQNETIEVTAENLTADIVVQITGDDAAKFTFNLDDEFDVRSGGVVLITYTPIEEGVHTAKLEILSEGADTKEILLNGKANPATGIESLALNSNIWSTDSKIMFNATAGELIEIYNITGQKIISQITVEGLNTIPVTNKGVLLVKVGDRIAKIVK